MKYLLAFSIMCASPAYAYHHVEHCDQQTLDDLYKKIMVTLVQSKGTEEDFETRRTSLSILRKLCKGQKSTHEMPKSYILGYYK